MIKALASFFKKKNLATYRAKTSMEWNLKDRDWKYTGRKGSSRDDLFMQVYYFSSIKSASAMLRFGEVKTETSNLRRDTLHTLQCFPAPMLSTRGRRIRCSLLNPILEFSFRPQWRSSSSRWWRWNGVPCFPPSSRCHLSSACQRHRLSRAMAQLTFVPLMAVVVHMLIVGLWAISFYSFKGIFCIRCEVHGWDSCQPRSKLQFMRLEKGRHYEQINWGGEINYSNQQRPN